MARLLLIGALSLMLGLPLAAQQQDHSASRPQQKQPADQKKDKDQKQTSPPAPASNPFPEAQSQKAAQRAQDQEQSARTPPDQPTPHAGNSTADQNPFPEAQSEKAAQQADQQPQPAAKPGSPPRQDGSSSHVTGLDLSGAGDSRNSKETGGTVLSPELGAKDTKVGNFYLQTGDFQGAYNRFAEAAKVDPGNAEAVFGLAEAARHLNRRADAISNYQLYLSALPNGRHSKDARKALKDLGAPPAS